MNLRPLCRIFLRKNFSCLVLIILITPLHAQTDKTVDVVVYGGTSAGVIAAYTAARYGKTVLLIEPGKHLGGLSSGGLGYTDIGNKYAVSGLARDFYRRVGSHYGKFEQWIFEPHVAEEIFNTYIRRGNVEVWYEHRLKDVRKTGQAIGEITLEHATDNAAAARVVKGKIFIDCTYEGDLMAKAGVAYTVGREANGQYNETYNGVQLRDKHQFPEGVDPYKIPGQQESGLLWGISTEALAPPGSGDKKVQAYNFRICLTRDPANKIDITEPPHYDASRYELLLRYLDKKPSKDLGGFLKMDLMPNNKTDINNNGPFSTDMIGMNYNYPEASYAERKAIITTHEEYVKGLLYFIGHDPRMPQHLRDQMLVWGYPKDEYTDNGHWSPQAYIREARRMVGEYVMTQHNCEGREVPPDGVGMAAYTMDSHNIQRVVVNGMVKNEGDVQIGGFPPYPISYRSLIPKRSECTNLFVPVCLSATHIAYGSIRMEPVFMVLAQSSSVAAVMAIDKKVPVQQVDMNMLKAELRDNPLADKTVPEILTDNDDKGDLAITGEWERLKNATGCYGLSLLSTMGKPGNEATARFHTTVKADGNYAVYVYCPKRDDAAPKVKVIVRNHQRDYDAWIEPLQVKVEGQTSGEWFKVGEYALKKDDNSFVEITAKGATGRVLADAVLIVPVR